MYFLGEGIRVLTSIPLPGSLIGMLLLLGCLQFQIIKLEQISTVADFLLAHLSFFFIPAGVALMANFYHIADVWILILLICFITTFVTMGLSGWSIQKLLERKGKANE